MTKPEPEVLSPEWYLRELCFQQELRRPLIDLYENAYEGRFKLAFATSKYQEVFAKSLGAVTDPWMATIVRARVERLGIRGFRMGPVEQDGKHTKPEADRDAMRMWQANELDEDFPVLCTEAIKIGEGYFLVWPTGGPDANTPLITVEHPSQMIVTRAAGNRRAVAAALKIWQTEWGEVHANLYLPNEILRFKRPDPDSGQGRAEGREGAAKIAEADKWEPRDYADEGGAVERHRLAEVPVVPMVNDGSMLPCRPPSSLIQAPHHIDYRAHVGLGRSDLADVVTTNDQINKLLCDMMVASEFAAYRQRYVIGIDADADRPLPGDDDVDGTLDDRGPEVPESGVERLMVISGEGSDKVTVGEFSATDLKNYTGAIEQRVGSMASRTSTPRHYLLANDLPSGDSMRAAEAGLTSTVRGKHKPFGGAARRAIRYAYLWNGQENEANAPMREVDWQDPETRTESEFIDSRVKRLAMGVPPEILLRDFYSPAEIDEIKGMWKQAAQDGYMFGLPGGNGLPTDQTPEDEQTALLHKAGVPTPA